LAAQAELDALFERLPTLDFSRDLMQRQPDRAGLRDSSRALPRLRVQRRARMNEIRLSHDRPVML